MEMKFSLNQFEANIRDSFKKFREEQLLFDVTLATDDGEYIQAHRTVLSSGSNFFEDIFMNNSQSNMLIYLKGVSRTELDYVIDFLYNGEAYVAQEHVSLFLKTGKELKLKGIEDASQATGFHRIKDSEIEPNSDEIAFGDKDENSKTCITSLKAIDADDDTFEFKVENLIKDESDLSNKNSNDNKSLVIDDDDEIFDFKDETCFKVEGEKVKINKNIEAEQQIQDMIEMKDGEWNCKICGKIMARGSYIKRHAETHRIGMPHACHICSKTFVVRSNLHTHISQIHTKLFKCDICEKTGMNKQSYRMHKLRKHKNMPTTN